MGRLWQLLQQHIDDAPYPPSERQVAHKLGVSPTTLANWRDPKKLPSRENLQAIADLVGVRYAAVLDAALYDTGYHESEVVSIRPATTLEGQLELAVEALAAFDRLSVAGESAERKRAELQARVDDLKSEIVSSRRVTGRSQSVTGL
jgi:transcriptional regulator with XRE-family HTH domain